MGVQVYDPGGRLAAAARPSVAPPQRGKPAPAPSNVTPPGDAYEWALRRFSGAPTAPPKVAAKKDEKGIADKVFGTTVGKGLGVVLNNPFVKAALQPLDVIGVPGRAVLGMLEQDIDFLQHGTAPDLGKLYNRTNPLHFIHGENAEDQVSGGQIVQQLGGTGNQYGDALAGFALDVGLDPATYAGGVGVVSKGLNATREGTELGAAVAAKAARTAEEAATAARAAAAGEQAARAAEVMNQAALGAGAVGGANDVNRARRLASEAAMNMPANAADDAGRVLGAAEEVGDTAAAVGRGHRGSLTGRQVRSDRVAEAFSLLQRADPEDLAARYGGLDVVQEATEEIMRRSGRGLAAGSRNLSPGARRLVEDALNIDSAAFRAHIPFTNITGRIPGTQGVAEALARTTGRARMGINNSKIGAAIADASTALDVENPFATFRRGENATADEFKQASTMHRQARAGEKNAGGFINLGQRTLDSQAKLMKEEIKAAGGDADYIRLAEQKLDALGNVAPKTAITHMFDYLSDTLAQHFGVTIPKLKSDRLNYLPHVSMPDLAEKVAGGDKAFAEKFVDIFGKEGQNLALESGRLKKRGGFLFKPDHPVKLPDGTMTTVGDMSIDEMNALGEAQGLGKLLQNNPTKLVEDYVQAVSEDVGRRAGRAELIAEGDPNIRYNIGEMSEQQAQEAAMEQAFARARNADKAAPEWGVVEQQLLDAKKAGIPMQAMADPRFTERVIQGIQSGDLSKFMEASINDGMERLAQSTTMLSPDGLAMMTNIKKEIKNPKMLERAFRAGTNYFKTYATLSPGFHVRNGLSAIIMNAADGVPFRTSARGYELWGRFDKAIRAVDTEGMNAAERIAAEMDAARQFMKTAPMNEQKALMSAMASGAGGRFAEAGVAEGATLKSKVGSKLLENALTRKTQHIGSWVEGGARTGMALDTVEAGGSIAEATSRITRIHFDYSQTSRLDDQAKGIFPFWSFMSRNLPMQIMQQWSRPAAYSTYEHFRENFADPTALTDMGINPEDVPEYIKQGKGIPMKLPLGMNWLEPDLPWTRLNEDAERYANILKEPGAALSNVNPLLTMPVEYTMKGDIFTGQKFGPDDYEHVSNPVELVASLPAAVAGQLEFRNGKLFVKQEALNAVYSFDPTLARASRLGSGGKPWETAGRWLGLPVRGITPEQVESAQAGAYYDQLDEQKKQDVLNGR